MSNYLNPHSYYSHGHLVAVEQRLQEYAHAIAAKEFERLGPCAICVTASNETDTHNGCSFCLFFYEKNDDHFQRRTCMHDDYNLYVPACSIKNTEDQKKRFEMLLRHVAENDYVFEDGFLLKVTA